jgi:hypothetical protein
MKSEIRKLGEHTPPACSVRRLAEPVCAQIVAQICNLFPQTRHRLAVGRALYFSNDFAISAVAFPLTPALSLRERENLPQPRANSDAHLSSRILLIARPDGGDETRMRTIAGARGSLFPLLRVRASQFSNCIVPAEGEGQGGEHGPSRHAAYGENSST